MIPTPFAPAIDNHKISTIFAESRAASAGGDLLSLYKLLAEALK